MAVGLWKLWLIAFSVTQMIIPLTGKPCFITNCPPGGKRSSQLTELSTNFETRGTRYQCSSCGPAGKGTCFGADMCCGSSFGCHFKTKETNKCLFNNLTSQRPCNEHFWRIHLKAVPCMLNGENLDGVCVADKLCCSLDQCKTDMACDIGLPGNQVDVPPPVSQ